jgi:hypothetical protein
VEADRLGIVVVAVVVVVFVVIEVIVAGDITVTVEDLLPQP